MASSFDSTLSSEQAIEAIKKQTDTILLSFSCGKDSIAAWLACRPHFRRIIPYYMYSVPDLEFVEQSLRYYESWFGCRIMRVPHPSLYRMLNGFVFQAPQNCRVIERARLEEFDYGDLHQAIRDDLGLGPEVYDATGVRAVDSPLRMIVIKRHGPIRHSRKQFLPVWDWNKARLLDVLTKAGVKLPVDYRIFGRSFDGIDYRFLEPIKRYFPRDYSRIIELFPLAELEIVRREYAAA